MNNTTTHEFRLLEFNIYNQSEEDEEQEEEGEEEEERQGGQRKKMKEDNARFVVQMFGLNEHGVRATIFIEDHLPFFYAKVGDHWTIKEKNEFIRHLRQKVSPRYASSILKGTLIKRKKLYGFDDGKTYSFIQIQFANTIVFNKVKNLWFHHNARQEWTLMEKGYLFQQTYVQLYESFIPPLLRFFHLRSISPSGWVSFQAKPIPLANKTTTSDMEFLLPYDDLHPLNDKETAVPYKVLCVDIEASSSHGDFPVPIKTYKKLATNIVDLMEEGSKAELLASIVRTAFFLDCNGNDHDKLKKVDLVYPKIRPTPLQLEEMIKWWLEIRIDLEAEEEEAELVENWFEKANKFASEEVVEEVKEGEEGEEEDEETDKEEDNEEEEGDEEVVKCLEKGLKKEVKKITEKGQTVMEIIKSNTLSREAKVNKLVASFKRIFPPLEGDKVTFIGSTIMTYGNPDPHLHHCIVLNSCDTPPGTVIESKNTEKEVLLAWTKFVQQENPDIITGYNIFSFDYEFLFRRSQELDCVEEFLKLSRNIDEVCASRDFRHPDKLDIDRSSTTLASGTFDMAIIKMSGRLQIDMLNWFRRSENLGSYKLDHVASHFIGDEVKKIQWLPDLGVTRIQTCNMVGLQEGNYVHFELIDHSSNPYQDGKKFSVQTVCKKEGWFDIVGNEQPTAKKVKWGLAKDDVSPKDIFRMTNEGPASRAIIAKYCIQDCNLVHYLFNKVDVMTDLVEMSKLCSVPMSFLIFRGQGIKLTSYVAKKCREKGVLMPTINKGSKDDGYEGAIVLTPKCAFYVDPISVGDFASLYPSSMLSENLCPSSKVWTKTYDLQNRLLATDGTDEYDQLEGVEYVDIPFNTYRWIKKTPTSRATKIKSGHRVCRFAQPRGINGEKAIMPSILEELLKARKDTRKLIPKTSDEFMKNILDKRQLAYKVTANSLYGQLGAKTSTFYEPDIAASTTATGRLLLTFAKRVVEECYGKGTTVHSEKYGAINTNAEYVYGDTDSVFFRLNFTDPDTGEKIEGVKALELSIEISQQVCHQVSKVLKQPHDFEYEKTFWPCCLFSKKRYVSIKYTFDATKGKRDEMGIVLKRRDNCPLVKDVFGGVIDILMRDKSLKEAVKYVHTSLRKLIEGKVPIQKLIISKSIRSFYKTPNPPAHKMLADRIAQREPGNKPASGDRIPYVFMVVPEKGKKKLLQGDKIENPTFIQENNLPIDYAFYITNQLMKPLLQLFSLMLAELWQIQKPPRTSSLSNMEKNMQMIEAKVRKDNPTNTEEEEEELCKKVIKKINQWKDKEVIKEIFETYLRECKNKKYGNQNIETYYKPTSKQLLIE